MDLQTLARRGANSAMNKWLNENPAVLGLLAIGLGVVLAGSGIYEMQSGVTRDKYGNEIKGGLGKFTSVVRILFGAAACVFGLYKIVAG
ncbi:MAG: hypothetical protein NXI04_22230 [Planctomycetaceae bacterium]|nr:hypothetical protein [Planctomycetaceae bacterium]